MKQPAWQATPTSHGPNRERQGGVKRISLQARGAVHAQRACTRVGRSIRESDALPGKSVSLTETRPTVERSAQAHVRA